MGDILIRLKLSYYYQFLVFLFLHWNTASWYRQEFFSLINKHSTCQMVSLKTKFSFVKWLLFFLWPIQSKYFTTECWVKMTFTKMSSASCGMLTAVLSLWTKYRIYTNIMRTFFNQISLSKSGWALDSRAR